MKLYEMFEHEVKVCQHKCQNQPDISEYRGFQAFHGTPCNHAETYPIFCG